MGLRSEDVNLLCRVLGQLESLCCLRFPYTSIGDTEAKALAKALKSHTRLTELDISHNRITSVGVPALVPVVRANKILHLDTSRNMIDGSCDELALAIADCGETLQSLNIHRTRLLEKDLNKMTMLFVLDISIGLGSEGLKYCHQLVELNVSCTYICLKDLQKSFQCCSQLVKLNISGNKNGTRGIWSLDANCNNLQELNFSHNGITSDGVPAVLDVMTNCCRLKELNLNIIMSEGVASLVKRRKHSSVLPITNTMTMKSLN